MLSISLLCEIHLGNMWEVYSENNKLTDSNVICGDAEEKSEGSISKRLYLLLQSVCLNRFKKVANWKHK